MYLGWCFVAGAIAGGLSSFHETTVDYARRRVTTIFVAAFSSCSCSFFPFATFPFAFTKQTCYYKNEHGQTCYFLNKTFKNDMDITNKPGLVGL